MGMAVRPMRVRARRAIVAVGAILLLGVSAWAASLVLSGPRGGSESEASGYPPGSPSPSMTQLPTTSERGNIVVSVGEVIDVPVGDDDGLTLRLSVQTTTVLSECPGRADPRQLPENGHFLVLDLTAELTSDVSATGDPLGYAVLGPQDFSVVAPDGSVDDFTSTKASWACYEDADLMPPFLDVGDTATGKIVLDVASDRGVLVYRPGVGNGWEWNFSP